MNCRHVVWLIALAVLSAAPAPAQDGVYLGAPDAEPTWVDADGVIHADWGTMRLRLADAEPTWTRAVVVDAAPTAVDRASLDGLSLTTEAYRAPIWPSPVDVLTVTAVNGGTEAAPLHLTFDLPAGIGLGDGAALAGGRVVMRFPTDGLAERESLDWGWTSGGSAMPGWASPEGAVDPAFRSIRAGMGGTDLVYQFRVRPGSAQQVAVGLCESHWADAGQRPVKLVVEGAPTQVLDPLALWGRHRAGVVMFDGRDLNGDGLLRVAGLPVEGAPDTNPILNAIWLFAPDLAVDVQAVVRGELNDAATQFVDVGGERDQGFYRFDALAYDLTVPPGETLTQTFLLAAPGGSVPDTDAWTPRLLRQAADEVWAAVWRHGVAVSGPDADALHRLRADLALLLMAQTQADGFHAALSAPGGLDHFSHDGSRRIVRALDIMGHHAEAERLVRLYWDSPVPELLARLVDGNEDDAGVVWTILGEHAAFSGNQQWTRRAWEKLAASDAGSELAARLRTFAEVAPAAVVQAHAAPMVGPTSHTGAAISAAHQVLAFRDRLVTEEARDLVVLRGLPPGWLDDGGLRADGLPTWFGPVDLQAQRIGQTVRVVVNLTAASAPHRLVVVAPTLDGVGPTAATVNGESAALAEAGVVVAEPSAQTVVTFHYR